MKSPEVSINGMAFTIFPMTQKQSPVKVQGQGNVDRLLRKQWHHP
jgi:hypothetical protein